MTQEGKGRDFFIVDNSISGWTGIRFLKEWIEIATDFLEIGALLKQTERPLETSPTAFL